MGSHSLILIVVIAGVASAQVALESFRRCVVDEGLSPYVIVDSSNLSLYAELDYRWNTRPLHVHPLAYFVPSATSDVQIGVRCARANNIPVIPKSGGHSAELLSFGNPDTIVISFQNMKNIQINAAKRTAVIESGALVGEIQQKLLAEGGFGLQLGSCPDVGIGGIALGGGEGVYSPLYNLTVDSILEMEMIDSNGDVHLVNENVNSDLFWALRGIGSGFIGIVTSFEFKLFNASDVRRTSFSIEYDIDDIEPVLLAYQEWMVWGMREGWTISTYMVILSAGTAGRVEVEAILVEEISSAPQNNRELFLNKARDIFPPPNGQNLTLTFPTYTELRTKLSNMEFISFTADRPAYVKKKSFFVNQTFNAKELENVIQTFRRIGRLNIEVTFFGFTGTYHKVPATDMSYVHRDYLYSVSPRVVADASVSEKDAQSALDWLNEFMTVSGVMDNGESYQNYVDLDLGDSFMERYYGVNFQRLVEIKTKWDPENYFRNEQSIPVRNVATKSRILLPTTVSFCVCLIKLFTNSLYNCVK